MRLAVSLAALGLVLIPSITRADEPMPDAKNEEPLDASFLRLYAQTRGFMLGRPVKPKPTPDGKAVLFLRSEPKTPRLSLYEFDVSSGKTKELLTPETVLKGATEHLSPEEKARRERMRISLGGFTDYQLTEDGRRVLLSLSGKLYVFERETSKVTELSTGKGTLLDPKFCLDGSKVGYVLDHDVFMFDLAANRETQVTHGGTAVKTHGLAEFVAQEEMYRYSGYWWSPDGQWIVYEEADHEGVEVWYVADPAKPGVMPEKQYYPRPGKKNVSARLGIVPVAGGATVWVDWDNVKYEYLAAVRWDKHGPLTIQVQDRAQRELLLLLVDPRTGKTKKLLEEHDPAFVNIHPQFPHWRDKDQFLWLRESSASPKGDDKESAAAGMLHYRDAQGKPIAPTDVASVGFASLLGIRPIDGRNYILYSFAPNPTQSIVAAIPDTPQIIIPHKPTEIAREEGEQSAAISTTGLNLVVTSTTLTSMPASGVFASAPTDADPAAFRAVGALPSVAIEPSFTPKVTIETVGGNPGDVPQSFYTAIVRPHGFDAKKTYPVIVDVYGGPHHLSVQRTMRPWLLMQWLADQGFIVVAMDNRGTPGRGRDWERAIYQKFASVPLDDQVRALRLLGEKHSEMDLDRVGIVGWSFGGYMSALAVLKRPDVFKAAVAGAPVTDWEDYDSHYTERYMGVLPESQRDYDEANLVKMADKLSRPLLLVHGTADDNVYFRHSLRLADALFRAGKDFDILPLPSLTHMVPDAIVNERLWTRIAEHFQKHLQKPK